VKPFWGNPSRSPPLAKGENERDLIKGKGIKGIGLLKIKGVGGLISI